MAPRRRLAHLASQLAPGETSQHPRPAPSSAETPPHPAALFADADAPISWAAADWSAMAERQAAEPLLRLEPALCSFDMGRFLRDGVAVFPGIMCPRAQARWVESLQVAQQHNDDFVRSDWGTIDWSQLGCEPPEQRGITPEQVEAAVMNSQNIPSTTIPSDFDRPHQTLPTQGAVYQQHHTDIAGVRTLRRHSVIPEYFPCGHTAFLMEACVSSPALLFTQPLILTAAALSRRLTHPDMLALHTALLGLPSADALRFDHSQLFTRPAGHKGNSWHSHVIGGEWDSGEPVSTAQEYERQNNSIFSICYPEGFEQGDGSLKFVRGSHLFRDPEHCRADTCVDADLEAGWLRGKQHPLTGEPLKVEGLSLPPGSIVSLYAHVAHAVEPRKAGSDRTRWASLFCFRDGEHKGAVEPPPSPGREVPPVWAQRAAQGDVPQVLRSLLEGGGIFGPHWVRYPPRSHT